MQASDSWVRAAGLGCVRSYRAGTGLETKISVAEMPLRQNVMGMLERFLDDRGASCGFPVLRRVDDGGRGT